MKTEPRIEDWVGRTLDAGDGEVAVDEGYIRPWLEATENANPVYWDERTQREKGYQQKHALIAFGSGGMTGKGVGEIPVGEHVPEAHNDMVFALIGEQLGLFGAAVVLGISRRTLSSRLDRYQIARPKKPS